MPAVPASKDEIIDKLFTVFRARGFEGASLSDLSDATGLGRSSLYHHFPDGKDHMVQAVLDRATAIITNEILDTARGPTSLKSRVRKIASFLDGMYMGGRSPCLLGQLSSSNIRPEARNSLRSAVTNWIEAIELLAKESGMTSVHARSFAEDWVARLQGALILQAATENVAPYKRAVNSLLDLARDDTTSRT